MGTISMLKSAGTYPTYVLFILMLVYLVNQMDRYVLAVSSKPMAKDIHFGDRICELTNGSKSAACNATDEASCVSSFIHVSNNSNDTMACDWAYSGTGIEYEVLAGPVFIVMFTLVGVTLSPLADRKKTNRRSWLGIAVAMWSLMNVLASFSTAYWQLVLTRLGLGVFEAICTPFAVSLINDYFDKNLQGTALGVYNWGIYIGFSMAFALKLLIKSVGWRWTFRVSGFPGILLSAVMFLTVKEPTRRSLSLSPEPSMDSSDELVPKKRVSKWSRLKSMVRELMRFEIILVALTSGVRSAGGYVLAYSVNQYFSEHDVNVAFYMSWVPLVGGVLGAAIGGFASDRLSKKYGLQGRLMLLVGSQLLAVPFAFGVVYLPNPVMAFISLLITFVFGEAYLGVAIAIVTTVVSSRARTFAVAVFIFVISNIGGNATLLVPTMNAALPHGLQDTLTILYCSGYIIAALSFFITLMKLRQVQELHTPSSVLLDAALDADEEFEYPSSPVDDGDDRSATSPLILNQRRSTSNTRLMPRQASLTQVDDRDMAECQSWSQAIAVNWRRSSVESRQQAAAHSAPTTYGDEMKTYRSTDDVQRAPKTIHHEDDDEDFDDAFQPSIRNNTDDD
ncbi:D-galactonate transporter-like [Sycon ciliatum]|uniref:D-galactonate transporter-like n=1 Tax=Sycon ciliatum TaxID=27933 RepID=UPI0031F65190